MPRLKMIKNLKLYFSLWVVILGFLGVFISLSNPLVVLMAIKLVPLIVILVFLYSQYNNKLPNNNKILGLNLFVPLIFASTPSYINCMESEGDTSNTGTPVTIISENNDIIDVNASISDSTLIISSSECSSAESSGTDLVRIPNSTAGDLNRVEGTYTTTQTTVDYSTSFPNVQESSNSAISLISGDDLHSFIRIVDENGNPSELSRSITHINIDGQLYPIIRTSYGGMVDTSPHFSATTARWGTGDQEFVRSYQKVMEMFGGAGSAAAEPAPIPSWDYYWLALLGCVALIAIAYWYNSKKKENNLGENSDGSLSNLEGDSPNPTTENISDISGINIPSTLEEFHFFSYFYNTYFNLECLFISTIIISLTLIIVICIYECISFIKEKCGVINI